MRLFYALTFDEASRTRLHRIARTAEVGTPTRAENIHLTLLFIGEAGGRDITCLKGVLSALPPIPTTYRCNGLGSFGSIIWAAVEPAEPLITCNTALVKDLKVEFPWIDTRPLTPHITLVRKAQRKDLSPFTPFEINAESISLMHSHRVGGVLTYTPIAVRPL